MIKPPPRIELWLRLRPMGVDVLEDLVKSGHLDPAVISAMPTHTVAHVEAKLNPDARSPCLRSRRRRTATRSRT